jgi:hypothetical protein
MNRAQDPEADARGLESLLLEGPEAFLSGRLRLQSPSSAEMPRQPKAWNPVNIFSDAMRDQQSEAVFSFRD